MKEERGETAVQNIELGFGNYGLEEVGKKMDRAMCGFFGQHDPSTVIIWWFDHWMPPVNKISGSFTTKHSYN